jgi:hypothetical protein
MDPITRREFMRRSVLLGAAALTAKSVAACSRPPDQVSDDTFLRGGAFLTLAAAAEALAPAENGFPGALDVDAAAKVDALLRDEDPFVQEQFQGALLVLEWIPLAWFGRRFSRLSIDRRVVVFQRLNASRLAPLRQVAQGVFTFVMLGFYSSEAVWTSIGYDGPWVSR